MESRAKQYLQALIWSLSCPCPLSYTSVPELCKAVAPATLPAVRRVWALFPFRVQKQAEEYFPLGTPPRGGSREGLCEGQGCFGERAGGGCCAFYLAPCPEGAASGQRVIEHLSLPGLSLAPTGPSQGVLAEVGQEGGAWPPEQILSSANTAPPHWRLPRIYGCLPAGVRSLTEHHRQEIRSLPRNKLLNLFVLAHTRYSHDLLQHFI